jgi:hypothetical protein
LAKKSRKQSFAFADHPREDAPEIAGAELPAFG